MRLNRYLASCGVASRRACDKLIEEGKVLINGKKAELGSIVNKNDTITINGKVLEKESKAYYLFYKPVNVLTTLSDPRGRPVIKDYLTKLPYRLFPVGRLDFDSEGLLLLTNDGMMAHRVQHPKYEIEKEYTVKTDRLLNEKELRDFQRGVKLDEGTTRPSHLSYNPVTKSYRVIIHQGWFRQIRRMFETFQVEVQKLKRVRVGSLEIGKLKPGEYRALNAEEVEQLKKTLNLGG